MGNELKTGGYYLYKYTEDSGEEGYTVIYIHKRKQGFSYRLLYDSWEDQHGFLSDYKDWNVNWTNFITKINKAGIALLILQGKLHKCKQIN